MSFFNKSKKINKKENNLKAIEKVKQSHEYQLNQKQIEIITKVLVEHADVPQEILDTLIDSVQKNVTLEYNASNFYN